MKKSCLITVIIGTTILLIAHYMEGNGAKDGSFEVVEMNVSAYDAGECCCGDFADGITASGVAAVGLICAAPPEYPFGTKMTVVGATYTVQDRGGAIKGNKLDLLMESHYLARQFGRRYINVKVHYEQ